MSNNQTGFIKIIFLLLALGVTNVFFGCAESKSQLYTHDENIANRQEILNGQTVTEQSPIAKKVLFLSTGTKLTKTPTGGYIGTQTSQCTASAISSRIILTAAHCLKGINGDPDQTPDSVFIILGLKPWKSKFNSKLWFAAEKIMIHENFLKSPNELGQNDLALVLLKRELPADYITELATDKDLNPDQKSIVKITMAGYGLRSSLKDITVDEAQKKIGELFQTQKIISNYNINNLTIEIDQRDQRGICSGDSGGPGLVFNNETKKYKTIGVVSGHIWDELEKQKIDPENKLDCFGIAVYTNVMNPGYADWIQKTMLSMK